MQPRLKAGLWVRGQIAICQSQLITAMVAHKGNEDAGAVLLKLNRFADGCFVYSRVTTLDGDLGWMLVAGGRKGGGKQNLPVMNIGASRSVLILMSGCWKSKITNPNTNSMPRLLIFSDGPDMKKGWHSNASLRSWINACSLNYAVR